jgi:hypothetical protein
VSGTSACSQERGRQERTQLHRLLRQGRSQSRLPAEGLSQLWSASALIGCSSKQSRPRTRLHNPHRETVHLRVRSLRGSRTPLSGKLRVFLPLTQRFQLTSVSR